MNECTPGVLKAAHTHLHVRLEQQHWFAVNKHWLIVAPHGLKSSCTSQSARSTPISPRAPLGSVAQVLAGWVLTLDNAEVHEEQQYHDRRLELAHVVGTRPEHRVCKKDGHAGPTGDRGRSRRRTRSRRACVGCRQPGRGEALVATQKWESVNTGDALSVFAMHTHLAW